ncbi:hypothetical protein B0H10DRAFT_1949257 [Mycena sp. CBHHK59/15]|nr:hypothetical protein B0H10DRAFT_1949257 [Mycena sp. CBHHK59/15]
MYIGVDHFPNEKLAAVHNTQGYTKDSCIMKQEPIACIIKAIFEQLGRKYIVGLWGFWLSLISPRMRVSENCQKSPNKVGVRHYMNTFHDAVKWIVPNIIALLSDPDECVCVAVLQILLELLDQDVFTNAINSTLLKFINDLHDSDWHIQVARLQIFIELIKTTKVTAAITNVLPDILSCHLDTDEDVRLTVVQALIELAKQG